MTFMYGLVCFYITIIIIYFINCVINAVFSVRIVGHLYILMLEKLFSVSSPHYVHRCQYAASVLAEEPESVAETLITVDSLESLNLDETLIERDIELTEDGMLCNQDLVKGETIGFKLHHPIFLIKSGIEAIIEDSVTKRFTAAELRVWNFLARNSSYVYLRKDRLNVVRFFWLFGFLIRYLIFLPCRAVTFFLSIPLIWIVGVIGQRVTNLGLRTLIQDKVLQAAVRLSLCPFSALVRFHNLQHRPKHNSICVANHTTPFDWCVLASDVTYAVVGQKQPGFFGLAETVISSAVPAVWFNRDEVIDRTLTANKLKKHVHSPSSVPLLIFPEGTCINNTSVMKFKKGCFEIGAPIYPVAIKYNSLFADCFWNSSRHTLLQYTFSMLTSWAMVVDVWYLAPTRIRDGEDGIQFAKRVQQSIAKCGGLVDINWDGELKRRQPKDTLRVAQQKNISRYVVQVSELQCDTADSSK